MSWAMYDWANSAFATTVMAGFFPLFFKAYWADPADPARSTFVLGMANSAASILVAGMAPFLGAVADRGTAKKRLLATFAFMGAAMTGGLWFVSSGNWVLAVCFYVAASVGFAGGNIFYDSLLPGIADESDVDRVSALGFAMGYIGGGLLFLVNVLMVLKFDWFGIPDKATAIRLAFLSVSVWWVVFSIPIFVFLEEPRAHASIGLAAAAGEGWRQLARTFRQLRHLKVVGTFLLAYWFYIDGVDTIVKMAVDYGKGLGFPDGALITALLLVQFVGFPAALLYGRLAGKIGTKPAIQLAIAAYGVATLLAVFMHEIWHFYMLAVMVGLFQGGIQALSRSLYTRLIPAGQSAEFFGFFNMLGKFAAVLGPALMGSVTLATGSPRLGILSVLILFVAGGVLLQTVDVEQGRRMAREELA